jgi:hypothetical protein
MDPTAHESVARMSGRRPLRDWLWLAAALPAGCWLLGAFLFVRADGSLIWRLPRLADGPAAEHNVASFRLGPTLRASSYYRDVLSQHHPAFVLDGRARPSRLEKWTSGLRDQEPWLEVSWHKPRALQRVVIHHAGSVEPDELTIRRYRLRCLTQSEKVELAVRDNRASVAEHAFACRGATGVRIDWQPNAGNDGLVRIYEIEVWGQ